MGTDVTVSVAFIIAILGAVSTAYNLSASRKKSVQSEDSKMEEIRTSCLKANMKLDTACGQLNTISADVKSMQTQINQTEMKVAVIERDQKTTFTRVDELRERLERLENGKA